MPARSDHHRHWLGDARTPSCTRRARRGTRPAPARTSCRRRAGTRRRRVHSTSAMTNHTRTAGSVGSRAIAAPISATSVSGLLHTSVGRCCDQRLHQLATANAAAATNHTPVAGSRRHVLASRRSARSCDRVQRSGVARLFLAVWPPAPVVERLRSLPRPDEPGVRWVPPTNWHVTVRFFGDAEPSDVLASLADDDAPCRDRGVGSGRAPARPERTGRPGRRVGTTSRPPSVLPPPASACHLDHDPSTVTSRSPAFGAGPACDLDGHAGRRRVPGRPRSCSCAVTSPAMAPPTTLSVAGRPAERPR